MITKNASNVLRKIADYSDTFVHDFYDKTWSDKDDDLTRLTKYYNALDKAFTGMYAGKHGVGYYGHGSKKEGPAKDIYIDVYGKGTLPYADWKKQTEQAIAAKDLDLLDDLTGLTEYYVKTNDKGSINSFENVDKAVDLLYKDEERKAAIKQLIEQHMTAKNDARLQTKQSDKVTKHLIKQINAIDRESDTATKALRKQIRVLQNKAHKLWEKGIFDSEEEKQIDKELQPLYKQLDKALKPYTKRTDAIWDEVFKISDPYDRERDAQEALAGELANTQF